MKIDFIWGTDIHLDCIDDVFEWAEKNLASLGSDSILLTGDISVGPSVIRDLKSIREAAGKQIYCVLGNHDYWDSSFSQLRSQLSDPSLKDGGITWMGSVDFVPFGEKTAVIGHDGWYDALHGDVKKSRFIMKDWFKIEEFSGALRDIVGISRQLASEGSQHVMQACEKAIAAGRDKLVILTHFPPFAEACLYRGKQSEPDALPWYSSKIMGDALLALSEKYPHVNFTVLCGHTHSHCEVTPRPNLRVVVGDSDYGAPVVRMVGVNE